MKNYQLLNGSNLAYIGDAYYELMVRTHLLELGITKSSELRKKSLHYVSATAHAEIYEYIKDDFNELEQKIFLRGRNNAPTGHRKNVDRSVYVISSGFEAVIGYLYLCSDFDKLKTLLDKIFAKIDGEL